MGSGGQMNVSTTENDVLKRVPVSKPSFGIGDLKKAIPPHCFKRSLIRSFGYLFHDLILTYSLYYIASNYIPLLPQTLTYVAWPLYWIAQGAMLMRLLLLGHECSHHAFSEYQWIDDAVGFFLHTVTLYPYFSSKYRHARHHAHTNSIEFEEEHVPKRKSDTFFTQVLNNGPGNVLRLFVMVTLGLPLYFSFNVWGRDYGKFVNHFLPQSAMFHDRERAHVVLSDVGIIAVMYALYHYAMTQGFQTTLFVFGIPLFGMSCLFIIISYLNHTHPSLPRYDSTEWDWLRGALATVDRDFGAALNWVFHDASRTHVVHHLFPSLPHYHAVEARDAVKPILGEYYKYDNTPFLKALWRDAKECIYVEQDDNKKGVYWFFK